MTTRRKKWQLVDQTDPNRGRVNRDKLDQFNPADTEERPVISPEDLEATRKELQELKRRMTRKAG